MYESISASRSMADLGPDFFSRGSRAGAASRSRLPEGFASPSRRRKLEPPPPEPARGLAPPPAPPLTLAESVRPSSSVPSSASAAWTASSCLRKATVPLPVDWPLGFSSMSTLPKPVEMVLLTWSLSAGHSVSKLRLPTTTTFSSRPLPSRCGARAPSPESARLRPERPLLEYASSPRGASLPLPPRGLLPPPPPPPLVSMRFDANFSLRPFFALSVAAPRRSAVPLGAAGTFFCSRGLGAARFLPAAFAPPPMVTVGLEPRPRAGGFLFALGLAAARAGGALFFSVNVIVSCVFGGSLNLLIWTGRACPAASMTTMSFLLPARTGLVLLFGAAFAPPPLRSTVFGFLFLAAAFFVLSRAWP
mmetsp:Transcript_6960/g.24543  ORF Transcript_6960/g.24543 Transcript_6960/m.24543 type:complete len:362 (+) Transcript_6960:335-1420(+)